MALTNSVGRPAASSAATTPQAPSVSEFEYDFGFHTMGPIVAECCQKLLGEFDRQRDQSSTANILFCARGGLVIRRSLELYLEATKPHAPCPGQNFMVSRLSAARLAYRSENSSIAQLLDLEFAGRSCAQVAAALSQESTPESTSEEENWSLPYSFQRFHRLLNETAQGQRQSAQIERQASYLRQHLHSLTDGSSQLFLVDTGVFGSIGHFLSTGLPEHQVHMALLFRANYKGLDVRSKTTLSAAVCHSDHYNPFQPKTVFRLYWPFLEAFFEPPLPSVVSYTLNDNGEPRSNLQIDGWRQALEPSTGTLRAGAWDYLRSLQPSAVKDIATNSTRAWSELQRAVIYPTAQNVEVLGVSPRSVDFGFDEQEPFGYASQAPSTLSKLRKAQSSMWPEGELRMAFPRSAGIAHKAMEAIRVVSTLRRGLTDRFFAS